MKIPEYIQKKLYERMRAGQKLNALDCEIHEWMQKKGIEKNTSFLNDDEFSLISLNTILLVTEPITLKLQTERFITQYPGDDEKQTLSEKGVRLKINKYEFNVTNKDLILDNGACYQCITLKHTRYESKLYMSNNVSTLMSKNQFKQLYKEGKVMDISEQFHKKYPHRYPECKIWRFNFKEESI